MASAVTALTLATVVLSGCGDSRDHPAEVAAAKCGHALHEALHLASTDTSLNLGAVKVTKLDADTRRVEGLLTYGAAQGRTFVCEVVPDASDTLRHLRVTRLEMGPGK
jgi:hypothetical protein